MGWASKHRPDWG